MGRGWIERVVTTLWRSKKIKSEKYYGYDRIKGKHSGRYLLSATSTL